MLELGKILGQFRVVYENRAVPENWHISDLWPKQNWHASKEEGWFVEVLTTRHDSVPVHSLATAETSSPLGRNGTTSASFSVKEIHREPFVKSEVRLAVDTHHTAPFYSLIHSFVETSPVKKNSVGKKHAWSRYSSWYIDVHTRTHTHTETSVMLLREKPIRDQNSSQMCRQLFVCCPMLSSWRGSI